MENKIINTLLELGIPANIKGFGYIIDALCVLDTDRKIRICELYQKIADKNDSTKSRVERAIRHAFSIMFKKDDKKDIVKKYFDTSNHSNGNLLLTFYIRIKQEANEEWR